MKEGLKQSNQIAHQISIDDYDDNDYDFPSQDLMQNLHMCYANANATDKEKKGVEKVIKKKTVARNKK